MATAHAQDTHHAPLALEYEPGLPLTNGKLIVWLFLSTEIMFFAGLIGTYIVLRFGAPMWPKPHDVHLSEPIGAFNTFVLICSSVTIVLGFEAAKKNKAGLAKAWVLATFLLQPFCCARPRRATRVRRRVSPMLQLPSRLKGQVYQVSRSGSRLKPI